MNIKTTILLSMAAISTPLVAMPTKQDIDKVSAVVQDLMRPEQEAMNAGRKTRTEVAQAAISLAEQADSEAAKLLLLKGAFNLYVRDGAFDEAVGTLKTLKETIPDMPPQIMANMIESSLRSVSKKNGGQLYRLLDETKTYIRYQNELKVDLARSAKEPANRMLHLKIAEKYAVLGNWTKALEEFTKGSDRKSADIAQAERGEKTDLTKKAIADFWWDYPVRRGEEIQKAFKQHAAALYEAAIAAGDISGLTKVQAERRIEEAKELGEQNVAADVPESVKDAMYCIVDLSSGPDAQRYPVTYRNDMPKGGWTDEYKTKKLVLRRINPGSFQMGSGSQNPNGVAKVRISKPYYIGVFEFTQKQCELLLGGALGDFKGNDMYPVCGISYQEIRGSRAGSSWPKSNAVDRDSVLGRLRSKTGLTFDLPTEAQWEYACRAGKKTDFSNGKNFRGKEKDPSLDKLARYGDETGSPANVGSYQPNAWDLYDVHGNINEWCRDWCGSIVGGTDPKGAQNSERGRVVKSGTWSDPAWICALSNRFGRSAEVNRKHFGFRLSIDIGVTGEVVSQDKDMSAMARDNVKDSKRVMATFKTGAKPGTITTLKIADDCNIEFAYCPAGAFKMGYKGVEKIAPLHDVTISYPFWMSKRKITKRQFVKVGVTSEDRDISADVYNPVASIEKFAMLMNEKYGKLLPKGYVFRVATEAEYEYVSKAGAKKDDPRLAWGFMQNDTPNPWGINGLFHPWTKLVFQDRVPAFAGKDLTYEIQDSGAVSPSRVVMIDYSKQPKKDPLMWSIDEGARYLRREISKDAMQVKLTAHPDGSLCGSVFYLVAAPNVDSLNKFVLK